jgi:hypothetical protein
VGPKDQLHPAPTEAEEATISVSSSEVFSAQKFLKYKEPVSLEQFTTRGELDMSFRQ